MHQPPTGVIARTVVHEIIPMAKHQNERVSLSFIMKLFKRLIIRVNRPAILQIINKSRMYSPRVLVCQVST